MLRNQVWYVFVILAVVLPAFLPAAQVPTGPRRPTYPPADRVDASDVFHGVRVPDPYRWLEDLESPKTRAWVKAQDDLTRRELDGEAFRASRRRIERLAAVRRYTTPIRRGERWFFFETDSNGISGRVLMVREGANAPRPLIDLRATGGPNALSGVMSASPDGRLVAYGRSLEDSRWLRLHVVKAATGAATTDTLENLHASMPSIAWAPDGRSFFYVRLASPSGPLAMATITDGAVMRHVIGTPQSTDQRVFNLPETTRARYSLSVSGDGWLVITTNAAGVQDNRVWVRRLDRVTASLTELFPGVRGQFAFLGAHADAFWFLTSVDAPRQRVIRVDPLRPRPEHWREIVAQPDAAETIGYADLIAERLVVFSTRDAAPRVRIHALSGAVERELPLPPLGTVWGPSVGSIGFSGRPADRKAYYLVTGAADPGSVYELDPQTGSTTLFLRPAFGFDPQDFVGRQVFYTAKDGTRIPMFIAHHKDVQPDGARPALMYGYGAFGWSAFPWFQPHVLAWLEAGGVYAIPCLRGGGEYGATWHEAAIREKKQTSVDDYIAAAEWLIANRYAAPNKLVATGGSVSGVIAAAAIVQRPALFGAAVIDIPALDMVRYDRHTGAASWIPEFGSTAAPVEFAALRNLSPYHNLDPAVCYPPTLVLAGEKDDIAVPSHAYKFVAAMQHAQPCGNPALLQVAWGAGHTFGTSNDSSAETWARQLAFIGRALGLASAASPPTPQVPELGSLGQGDTTMVFIPCMSCRWSSWEPFMRRNADRWRMFAVTLPGFGGTAVPALPLDGADAVWHDHAVEAVLRLLEDEDLKDVVLVGHSFGSTIALQVAARAPARVRAFVNVDGGIVSSRSWFRDDSAARLEAARTLALTYGKNYDDAEAWRRFNAPAAIAPDRQVLHHGMFMATPRDVVRQYWRENLLRDLNPLLRGLSRPVLDIKAIPAADDTPDQTRQAHLDVLAESGASAVRTVFFYNTGHFVHELRPQLLEDAITDFLAGRTPPDPRPAPPRQALPGRFGHIEAAGSGTPMILMPCLGCDWRAFDEFMSRHRARFRMYAVTWPGMADTPIPRAGAAGDTPLLDNVTAATRRLIEREGLVRAVLVAHSAAGPLAIKIAAEHPQQIGSVITVDATIQNDTTLGFTPQQRRAWADAEMATVLRSYDDDQAWRALNTVSPTATTPAVRNAMYEAMWRTPPREHVLRYWREWLRLDSGSLLSGIEVPVLALFALPHDATAATRKREAILDQFKRNRASRSIQVEFIERTTHSIWETTPAAFDAAVTRFVDQLRATAR